MPLPEFIHFKNNYLKQTLKHRAGSYTLHTKSACKRELGFLPTATSCATLRIKDPWGPLRSQEGNNGKKHENYSRKGKATDAFHKLTLSTTCRIYTMRRIDWPTTTTAQ